MRATLSFKKSRPHRMSPGPLGAAASVVRLWIFRRTKPVGLFRTVYLSTDVTIPGALSPLLAGMLAFPASPPTSPEEPHPHPHPHPPHPHPHHTHPHPPHPHPQP
eukprot:scaffold27297_cov46-Phaeocystis_antarctica.AAC.1